MFILLQDLSSSTPIYINNFVFSYLVLQIQSKRASFDIHHIIWSLVAIDKMLNCLTWNF